MTRIIRDLPLNRVEGDIEVRIEIADGRISDAWSAGTLFRGFERMLVGRNALDGLVVTPRVCGICTTTHLMAAAKALDAVAGVTVPDNGRRLRNLALMGEHIQSDVRHSVLMYMADFANPAHAAHPLFTEAVARFAPFSGSTSIDVLRQTRRFIELIALIGGQWPHSSFMVPGGVTAAPPLPSLLSCRSLIAMFRDWYETAVLGCPIERWREVRSAADLDAWLTEPAHRDGVAGFLLRFGRAAGLDRLGRGHGLFLSYGGIDLPRDTAVEGSDGCLIPAGVTSSAGVEPFDAAKVTEQVASSWYEPYADGRHPFEGETKPYACGAEGGRYSWVKAPRYDGRPAETGPLAEALLADDPLFRDIVTRDGPNALVRQLARLVRPARLLPAMETWVEELIANDGLEHYTSPGPIRDGRGAGLIEAARGALGHWVVIEDGQIAQYQIVTPTAWNGSPRDDSGVRGPWEEALIGAPVANPDDPFEAGSVLRSFDPCMVCAVHAIHNGRRGRVLRLGG